ncbi:MAG: hypothetical protein BM556_04980 [Bacteriovorax sp. MedPE-SWde]|nr:MAG: hypothetical protein BM556_04980 [Bacteriovorax sp. MedPE-SWde]
MNDGIELIEEKRLEKLKAKYSKQSVLIVSSNKTIRNTLKRAFATLGFQMTNISVAEDYSEAKKTISEFAPHVVISNLYLSDGKSAIDLQKHHREYFPNSLNNLFMVLTEIDEHYVESLEHEYELDGLFLGQFNFKEYVENFAEVLERKMVTSKADILEAKVKEALAKKDAQAAFTFLTAATEAGLEDYRRKSLEADAHYLNNDHKSALKLYEEVLTEDSCNFHALINTITINYSDKNYGVAHDYCEKFLSHFSSPPRHLPVILKIFLFNKEYFRIIKLCKEYDHDDRLEVSVKLNIAAALALCGKSLLADQKDFAVEAFERAISVSGGQSFNILQMVVTSLVSDPDLIEKSIAILEKYRDNFSDVNQFVALEFDVLTSKRSAQENLSEGMMLIKKNVKSYRIYETLISSSLETGRRKEAIEDLVFEACREFPDYSTQFKRYI